MNRITIFTLFALLLNAAIAKEFVLEKYNENVVRSPAQDLCTYEASDGSTYYAYNMVKTKSPDYESDPLENGAYMVINICNYVNSGVCEDDQTPACNVASGDEYNAGELTTGKFTDYSTVDGGFTLTYKNGQNCPNKGVDRKTIIDVVCDEDAGTGKITKFSENDCVYSVTMKSKYGCPGVGKGNSGGNNNDDDGGPNPGKGSDDIGGGAIFLIIFFCGFFLYFAIGGTLMYVKFEARGTDIVPNKEFWIMIPGLVKDGTVFIIDQIKGCAGGGNSYETL